MFPFRMGKYYNCTLNPSNPLTQANFMTSFITLPLGLLSGHSNLLLPIYSLSLLYTCANHFNRDFISKISNMICFCLLHQAAVTKHCDSLVASYKWNYLNVENQSFEEKNRSMIDKARYKNIIPDVVRNSLKTALFKSKINS